MAPVEVKEAHVGTGGAYGFVQLGSRDDALRGCFELGAVQPAMHMHGKFGGHSSGPQGCHWGNSGMHRENPLRIHRLTELFLPSSPDGVELFGQGRPVRVRPAHLNSTINVKDIPSEIGNRALAEAFKVFGEVVRAVVFVDEKSHPMGEGMVEFKNKKNAVQAVNDITKKLFVLSRAPNPIRAEFSDMVDNHMGLLEVRDGEQLGVGKGSTQRVDCLSPSHGAH